MYDGYYDKLQEEIDLVLASAPKGSEAVQRLLKPAYEAIYSGELSQMSAESRRLFRLRTADRPDGTRLS